ncbi:BTB/POZ domain-containing protein At2g13690 [Ananas comosus]|uniref:BTB/POZ domain-containing protein n=1 Tax=Ananas comosus TaxID=4615 RepID=A0A199UDL2_ANACO|nr:BTB/POZ domain-containing protein At2g13690 [Ananas comosus]OAY62947.1 BTB/POZ domain-containing protein [Ananas comosus]
MADRGSRISSAAASRRPRPRAAWCCSFAAVPGSPDLRSSPRHHYHQRHHHHLSKLPPQPPPKPSSLYSSPSPTSKLGLGIIDPRRILSPGRVSPIDSDPPLDPLPEIVASAAAAAAEPEISDPAQGEGSPASQRAETDRCASSRERSLDLRLRLKGKDGTCLLLELDSKVLCESSRFFAAMVLEATGKISDELAGYTRIEVGGIEDTDVFRKTIELMYEEDALRALAKAGVSPAIDILEVSSTIMFDRGITSCLKYIEGVPWTESEEEKLKSFFSRCTLDEATAQDVLARLRTPPGRCDLQDNHLAIHLIQSVVNGICSNARKEMQSLVNGLLSKSSVYQKDPAGLSKESLYKICHSCLNSLVELFEEASGSAADENKNSNKPLVERISKQVENLNWLLEILTNNQMAEDFVDLWAQQAELIKMHEKASPMVRYELSRVSASLFIALGKGKLHCRGETRSALFCGWFRPLLMDFGWLQRCSKGLDVRMLEETLGQALLTLPLSQQQSLFEEWFRFFAGGATECPNLGQAFQVWWRRSFVRSASFNL